MFYYINSRLPYTDGHLFFPDGETPPGTVSKNLSLKELFSKIVWTKSNGLVSSPLLAALLLFFVGKETLAKNFLTDLYKNLTVEVLSPDNNSTPEYNALTDLCAYIGVGLANPIFANNERTRLDMKKQEEEISKRHDFFDDDDDDDDVDDKKDFTVDSLIKMEDDFPSGCDDDGNVLVMVKKESDNEMDDGETILFVSPKRKNDIGNRETILYASPTRKSEDEIDEKI